MAAGELAERAVELWRVLEGSSGRENRTMERSGRKAHRLGAAPPEAPTVD
jgi:hypothetical protein